MSIPPRPTLKILRMLQGWNCTLFPGESVEGARLRGSGTSKLWGCRGDFKCPVHMPEYDCAELKAWDERYWERWTRPEETTTEAFRSFG